MSETTTLTMETMVIAPVASSSTTPPRGILRSKSTSDVSLSTSEDSCKSPSISFAPLPPIEGRKRRSIRPTGVAGRAEMLRRSRRPIEMIHDDYEDEEYVHPSTAEEEDLAFPDVGKFVKGLWRSLSRSKRDKQGGNDGSSATDGSTGSDIKEEGEGEGRVWEESIGSWAQSAIFEEPFRAFNQISSETSENRPEQNQAIP